MRTAILVDPARPCPPQQQGSAGACQQRTCCNAVALLAKGVSVAPNCGMLGA